MRSRQNVIGVILIQSIFKTFIVLSKVKARLEVFSYIAELIKDLNPVIRGWTSYYANSDIKTVAQARKQDNLMYLKLRKWAKRRCGNINDGHRKYWTSIGGKNWVFATGQGNSNPLRLLTHDETACSSNNYVKVKGDKSPFDGDTVYWSIR